MPAPTFLAKHPAYLRYVLEVASGELVMPEYERVTAFKRPLRNESYAEEVYKSNQDPIQFKMERTV